MTNEKFRWKMAEGGELEILHAVKAVISAKLHQMRPEDYYLNIPRRIFLLTY